MAPLRGAVACQGSGSNDRCNLPQQGQILCRALSSDCWLQRSLFRFFLPNWGICVAGVKAFKTQQPAMQPGRCHHLTGFWRGCLLDH